MGSQVLGAVLATVVSALAGAVGYVVVEVRRDGPRVTMAAMRTAFAEASQRRLVAVQAGAAVLAMTLLLLAGTAVGAVFVGGVTALLAAVLGVVRLQGLARDQEAASTTQPRRNMRGADRSGLSVTETDLRGLDLRGANLREAHLARRDLRGTDLRGVDLHGAELIAARLPGTDLRGADLTGTHARQVDLAGADLSAADLRDADLRGARLGGAHLRTTDLSGSDLGGADLCAADLRDADLNGASLRGTDLRSAQLSGADLRDADLRAADLCEVDLRGATLIGADLRETALQRTRFEGVIFDLRTQWPRNTRKQLLERSVPLDPEDPLDREELQERGIAPRTATSVYRVKGAAEGGAFRQPAPITE